MTQHPLVTQLRFTRGEFLRGLAGLTAEEAARRYEAINQAPYAPEAAGSG